MLPGICDYSKAYQTAHHLMLAHGKAVQAFREGGYGGQIGMVLNLNGLIPASESDEDRAATQRVHDETHALFLDPIYNGTYPQALFEYIGPHQPKVQTGDAQIISQPIDFLGLNYYNTDYVAFDLFGGLNKARLTPYSAPGWGRTEMNWGIDPDGIKREVLHLKENYGNPNCISWKMVVPCRISRMKMALSPIGIVSISCAHICVLCMQPWMKVLMFRAILHGASLIILSGSVAMASALGWCA